MPELEFSLFSTHKWNHSNGIQDYSVFFFIHSKEKNGLVLFRKILHCRWQLSTVRLPPNDTTPPFVNRCLRNTNDSFKSLFISMLNSSDAFYVKHTFKPKSKGTFVSFHMNLDISPVQKNIRYIKDQDKFSNVRILYKCMFKRVTYGNVSDRNIGKSDFIKCQLKYQKHDD